MARRPQPTPGKVLIVSNWSRGVVVRAAQECGFLTDVARDISEAVVSLHRRRYQAVLADLDVSDVDCLELVLNVRDFDRHVPIAVFATDWRATEIAAVGTQPGLLLVAKSDRVGEVANNLARLSISVDREIATPF